MCSTIKIRNLCVGKVFSSQSDSGTGMQFAVWMRWGRVGYDGQNSLTRFGNVDK